MSNNTFLIKSSSNGRFGTGFCIHKDEKGSFLLTAGHVVGACGQKNLLVESKTAELLHLSDKSDTIDLALIYVEGLLDSTPLKLSDEVAQEGDTFTVVGYRPHKDDYAKEPLKGAIKKAYTLESKEHKRDIYELTINDGDSIEQGYSGSAVVSSVTGLVVAIATDRKTNGRQAYATPARYLREIWKEFPEDIFESFNNNNPYKGLNSFEYKDRHNYYGREEESKEVVERLKITKLFTLLGASGSGKSSLIFAGVVPLIEGDEIEILSFRPLSEPFKNLASVFIPTLYPDKLEQIEQSEKLTKKLINSDIKLDNLVQRFLEDIKAKQLYLIIDQFEELFTLTKEQEHQNQFLDQLLTLIDSELNVTLLISMRADFLSHISFYEPFNKAYNDHPSHMLSLLNHENLKRIIEEPAKKQGVTFQDGLVDRIIEEIEHEAGQLPLLEFALEQFWANKKGRIISHAVLDEMQSISHSISHYADKIYKNYPNYQASIEKVLIKLVNPGSGTEDTRRIASLDEFDKEARETITLLANERLVVTEDGNIDIIHEALIREWQRLKEWINKYRNFLEWEKYLRGERKFYMDNGEKKEDLLKDSKLLRAKEFLESHERYLSPFDREFVEESVKVANRKQLLNYLIVMILLLVVGWFMIFLIDAKLKDERVSKNIDISLEQFESEVRVSPEIDKTYIIPKAIEDKVEIDKKILRGFGLEENMINEYSSLVKLIVYTTDMNFNKKRWLNNLSVMKSLQRNKLFKILQSKAFVDRGNFYKKVNDMNKSLEFYKKSINLQLEYTPAYYFIGNFYEKEKNYKKAIDYYQEDIAQNSKYSYAYTAIAAIYEREKEYDKAIQYYQEDINQNPKYSFSYTDIGDIYTYTKKDYDNALKYYLGDIDIHPESNEYYGVIGDIYRHKKEYDKAIKFYEKEIKVNPDSNFYFPILGELYRKQKKHDKAIKFYYKSIELNLGDPSSNYIIIGNIYREKKEYAKAIEFADKAIALHSRDIRAYRLIGDTYVDKKEYGKAIVVYKKIVKLTPQRHWFYLSIFELNLIQNQPFDKELESEYIKLFKNQKKTFLHYEMLKILQSMLIDNGFDMKHWKQRYQGITLNWDFNELTEWINSIENKEIQTSLVEALNFFKQHQKENKKEIL